MVGVLGRVVVWVRGGYRGVWVGGGMGAAVGFCRVCGDFLVLCVVVGPFFGCVCLEGGVGGFFVWVGFFFLFFFFFFFHERTVFFPPFSW